MNNNTTSSSLGTTLIFITLLILKVTGYWNISWLWVFSPIWIPLGIVILVLIGCLIHLIFKK